MTRAVSPSPAYEENLYGALKDNPYTIRPVFYRHISVEILEEIIGGDPLFRIEGFERSTNYERLKEKPDRDVQAVRESGR